MGGNPEHLADGPKGRPQGGGNGVGPYGKAVDAPAGKTRSSASPDAQAYSGGSSSGGTSGRQGEQPKGR